MNTQKMSVGFANQVRLHIFAEPNLESEIVCKVRYGTELMIDLNESTDDFYKVCTAIGAEGFCQKGSVNIKS